jgi:hypothetical protein
VAPFFDKMAKQNPHIRFVQVPLGKSAESQKLIQGLGVPSIPHGHIYYPQEGLVETLSMNKKVFSDFSAIVDSYKASSCELPELDESGIFSSPYQRKHK